MTPNGVIFSFFLSCLCIWHICVTRNRWRAPHKGANAVLTEDLPGKEGTGGGEGRVPLMP